jgi:hypothetical protein
VAKRSLLLIFIDGLGIGPGEPGRNPLAGFDAQVLRLTSESLGPFPNGGICVPTDASLETQGLPQSATGQTTLFTGVNAPKHLGRHMQGFPGPSLKSLIEQNSLFRTMKNHGYKVTFANTFTPRFFTERPRWVSTTTFMTESAGIKLRQLDALEAGRSLFMDFTNRYLLEKGMKVPLRSPEDAGDILVELSRDHHLCLYEYFLTDFEGHRGTYESAVELLTELDRFLDRVVNSIDHDLCSLAITSDHGNIEDMSSNRHTRNPVPTILLGEIRNFLPAQKKGLSLDEITPLIERYFGIRE